MAFSFFTAATEFQEGSPPFNHETDIAWHTLFWAGSTSMAGYADTDPITVWYNVKSTGDIDQKNTANWPTMVASDANWNNKRTVAFSSHIVHMASAFSPALDYTNGVSIVMLARWDGSGANGWRQLSDGLDLDNRNLFGIDQTNKWAMHAGSSIATASPAIDTNPHLFVGRFNTSGNEQLDLDGTQIIDGVAGNETLNGVSLGGYIASNGSFWPGEIVYYAIYEGDFTADSKYANFKSWVNDYYGLSVV